MAVLDFLNFIQNFPPLFSILFISVGVSLLTTIIYKFTTNQRLMKEIREDVKRMQAEARSTKEPGKAAQLQKDMMKRSMQQFSAQTKSMIITLIPLFMLFGWMGSHLAYEPINPGGEFTTTAVFAAGVTGTVSLNASEGLQLMSGPTQEIMDGKAVWRLKSGSEGSYRLVYSFGEESYALGVLVTDKFAYEAPLLTKQKGIKKGSGIEKISIDLAPVRPFGSASFLGYQPGWLLTYILFSLVSSIAIRKVMKVH